jgi:hypothetical protein
MKLLRSSCALGRWGEIARGIAERLAVGAVLLILAVSAGAKDEVVVNVQAAEPSFAAGSDVILKVTILNHSQQKLTYFPCPRPYSAEVSDAKGQRVEPRAPAHPEGEEVSVCGANPLITVERGKTAEDKVKLNDMYDLLPGTYKAKLRWHFQVSFHETAAGSESRSIAVVSSTTTITVK